MDSMRFSGIRCSCAEPYRGCGSKISFLYEAQRLQAEQCYAGTQDEETGNEQLAADLYKAVLLAKTSIYAQAFPS